MGSYIIFDFSYNFLKQGHYLVNFLYIHAVSLIPSDRLRIRVRDNFLSVRFPRYQFRIMTMVLHHWNVIHSEFG